MKDEKKKNCLCYENPTGICIGCVTKMLFKEQKRIIKILKEANYFCGCEFCKELEKKIKERK